MSNDTSNFAKEIRSRVSFYAEYENKVHPLFDASAKNDKAPKPLNWATDVNPRRKWDEYVAVIMIKTINSGNATAGLDVVAEYVEEDAPISKSKLKLVDRFLDDALKIRNSVNRKFNTDTFSALQLVWFALLEQNKNFKIGDIDAFAKEFFKAHGVLTGNAVNKFDTEVRKFKINETDKKERIVKEFARRAIKNFANKYNQIEVAELYLDLMHIANVVTFRDDVRNISRDKKFDMLASQDFKCGIDGEELDIDDAIFGHDTPWSKGGLSSDAVIIRNTHNVDMGTMTISEYKAYLEFKKAREENK
jgi:hypothetical protein